MGGKFLRHKGTSTQFNIEASRRQSILQIPLQEYEIYSKIHT
jgi:hypothetical protein